MHKPYLRAALLAVLALAGCKRAAPPPEARLNTMSDSLVEQWIQLPRAEQAKLADEWADTIQKQTNAIRANPRSVELLPRVLPSLAAPVFQQAKFSASAGFSLPPYVVPGKPDAGVALHLARHGDHEAAARFAPDELRGRLEALKAEKNYPVEWTRLVGLVQVSAQLKLATGDPDGAMTLVAMHKQVGDLLDKKAAEGPLGAALLSAGKTALERAAAAWRDRKHNKPGLAEDAENALKGWAAVTAAPALPFGAPARDVELLFGAPARGRAVFADTPERVARVVDLLGLHLPGEGAQVVAAFLDAGGKLAEWQVAYRAKIDTLYSSPAQLAFRLTEAGFSAGKEVPTKNLYQQTFTAGDVVVEATRCNRSPALGGLVRIAPKGGPAVGPGRSLRDFGPIHLDRGYETNRLALHPATGGTQAVVKDVEAVKRVAKALNTPTPSQVTLRRDKDADLLSQVELTWPAGETPNALDRLLPSLWDEYGPARLEDLQDQASEHLAFTWSDPATRVRLRLPFDDRGPALAAGDVQAADQAKARVERARKIDQKERLARVAAGKTDERLSRSPGRVNEVSLAGLKLGQSKAEAEKALPKGKLYRRKERPDGVSVTFLTTPDKQMPYWARQLLLRYHDGRVVEVRLRYQRGPAVVKKGEPLLQALLDASGAAEALQPSWSGLWGDVPGAGKPVHYRWRDDRTVRTYQSDEGGMEVAWLDRPPETEALEAPPWLFVSTGIPHCQLGDPRSAVEAYFKSPATTSEGGEVYRTADSSPYEMIVVWYEGDKVSRLLAWHRQRCGATPKEVAAALSAAWGKDLDNLGAVRRQQGELGQVLGAYWWHDDRVRVCTKVQTTDQGPRVMTEWRTYPVAGGLSRSDG